MTIRKSALGFLAALVLMTGACGGGVSPTAPSSPTPAPSPAPAPSPTPTPSPAPQPGLTPKVTTVVVTGKTINFKVDGVPLGVPTPAVCTATYDNGLTADATDQCLWESENESVAKVGGDGVITPMSLGFGAVRATLGGVHGRADFKVVAPSTPGPGPGPKPVITTVLYGGVYEFKSGCVHDKMLFGCPPVSGATVEVTSPAECAGQHTYTGSAGQYRLEVMCAAASFRVRFAHPDGRDQNYTGGGGGEVRYDVVFVPPPAP